MADVEAPRPDAGGGLQQMLDAEQAVRERHPQPARDAVPTEYRRWARVVADELASLVTAPVDERASISDGVVAGATVRWNVRVYAPRGAADEVLPTQLFLHGGGYVGGSPYELVNDSLLAARSVETGLRIISLEYPLAPEHPYPTARDAAVDVYRTLAERADEFGIDASRFGIGGNSAGSTIVSSAALLMTREGGSVPMHVFLEVPAVSVAAVLAAIESDLADHPAVAAQLDGDIGVLDAYAPHVDELTFVGDADDLTGFPPSLLMIAELDVLRSGGEKLADRLRAQGTPVEVHLMVGHLHGSPGATAVFGGAREWQRILDGALRRAYGTEQPG